MKLREFVLVSSFLAAIAAPSIAQAYRNPWIYQLTPAGSCTYSVCFGISPDANTAVGVSSSSPIVVGADEQITPSPGQTFVATVWNLSSLPTGGPFVVAGTAVSALSSYSAALYSVASGGTTYVGTKFTSGGTTGFSVTGGSTVTPFTTSSYNSYGIGLGGVGGASIATGWAATTGTQCPCFYVISAPSGTSTGLNYFSTSSGIAYSVSTPIGGTSNSLYEAGVAGTVSGVPTGWSISYSRTGKGQPYTGPTVGTYTGFPSSGSSFGITPTFDTFNVTSGNTIGGADGSNSYGFLFTGTLNSYSGSYNDISETSVYGMQSSSMYVGTASGAAFVSSEYATYGNLYTWLSGYNWGPIAYPSTTHPYTTFGISDWTELDSAYQIALPSVSSAFYYVVGYGNATNGQTGYLAVFEVE